MSAIENVASPLLNFPNLTITKALGITEHVC